MVKRMKEVKIVKGKSEEGIVDTILKGVSYGTGVFMRKAADIGKVSETKSWKKVVSQTGALCEKVNTNTKAMFKKAKKTVKENISDMKESFVEGMESAADKTTQDKVVSEPVADQPPVDAEAKVEEIPVLERHADSVKIKKAIDEIAHKYKTSLPAKKKAGIKGKFKAVSGKVKCKIRAKKEAPVDADLEKQIENTTKGVKEI